MENNGSKGVVFQSMQLQVGDVLNLLKGIKEMLLIICILIAVNVVFNLVIKKNEVLRWCFNLSKDMFWL
ncbi:hypothetical protein PRUPE_6G154000 [Prunus persica]|uniref:Uncharacterized protein n=1 Tax=Prunus persica TaxID=3760 RepID=A0A251NQV7_PRUPE|nr:hypothetical protein PRUPE_6G154000 [Prunus persica]